MPRYFFDIIDAGRLTRDEFGDDLADDEEARDQAISLVADIAREGLPDGDRHEFIARARNERGETVYEASLALDGNWWPGRR